MRYKQEAEQEHPFWMHIRLNNLWVTLHILLSLLRIVYSILCLL